MSSNHLLINNWHKLHSWVKICLSTSNRNINAEMTTTTTSSAIKKHTTFNYLKLLQLPLSKTYRYLHATSDRINAIASRILQLMYRQTWCQATKMQILNIIILLYIPETILWLQYFFSSSLKIYFLIIWFCT